jgi:hypothetical protein
MVALPLNTIVDATKNRLTIQCAGIVTPDVVFGKAAPFTLVATQDVDAYVLHLYPEDELRAGTLMRRTHYLQVRLWVRTPDDPSEALFLSLCDAIEGAFHGDQSLGQGTVHSATMASQSAPAYIQMGSVVRRQRVWELRVVEDYTTTLAY